MTTLILGATAGVGRALGRAFAARGHSLILVARDIDDLEAEAAHLRLSFNVAVDCIAADASDLPALVEKIRAMLSPGQAILVLAFPIGASFANDDGVLPVTAATALINVNLLSVVGTVAAFLPGMLAADRGDIIGFGSIASIRGRRTNIVYSAAKRALDSYFQSLRHVTSMSGVNIQYYRLGYVDTQQSFGKPLLFPKASPEWIAQRVANNLGRDIELAHLPRFWWAIGTLVASIPWRLFRRLSF